MKTKDEIWEECYKRNSTLRETWRDAMEGYASQQLPTDEEIRNKALEIVGFDRVNPKTFTQEMAVNHILIFAKWVLSQIKQK